MVDGPGCGELDIDIADHPDDCTHAALTRSLTWRPPKSFAVSCDEAGLSYLLDPERLNTLVEQLAKR